jgi:predicted aspartyl protease
MFRNRFSSHRTVTTIVVLVCAVSTAAATSEPPVQTSSAEPRILPPAIIDNNLAIGGSDLAANRRNTRLTVKVSINGKGPFDFVVDSGADSSVVSSRIAEQLRLPAGPGAVIHTITSSESVGRVTIDSLDVGQTSFNDRVIPALNESFIGADGIIGIDALVNQRLMMDFEKRLVRAEDARLPAEYMDGEIVVTARRKRGQLILTEVKAISLPVDAVIDTGSVITIGNLALRNRLMKGNRDKFGWVEIIGVTGVPARLDLAIIAELELGSVTLRNVPIAFANVPPFEVFGLKREPALLLGTDILEKFRRVSLDFRARKVRFQLRKCGTTNVAINDDLLPAESRISSGRDEIVCAR